MNANNGRYVQRKARIRQTHKQTEHFGHFVWLDLDVDGPANNLHLSKIMSGDGNPRGSWFAVICLLVSGLMWTGILKGLGIMLPTFTSNLQPRSV